MQSLSRDSGRQSVRFFQPVLSENQHWRHGGIVNPFYIHGVMNIASLCKVEFKNTVLGAVKEHHAGTVYSSSNYAVFISWLWQTISEILQTSTFRKSAMGTWGYCKPFLFPWSGDFLCLYEVELKNTVLRQVKRHHGGTVHNYSNYAVVISRSRQSVRFFQPVLSENQHWRHGGIVNPFSVHGVVILWAFMKLR